MEIYWLLFIDTALSNFAFSLETQTVLNAVIQFRTSQNYCGYFIAGAVLGGSIIGNACNLVLGKILKRICIASEITISNKHVQDIIKYRHLIYITSALPVIGRMSSLLCGFVGIRPIYAILTISLIKSIADILIVLQN